MGDLLQSMPLRRQQGGEFLLFAHIEFLAFDQAVVAALEGMFFLFKMLELALKVLLAEENFFLQTLEFKLGCGGFLLNAGLGLVPRGLRFEGRLALLTLGLFFCLVQDVTSTLFCLTSQPLGGDALTYITEEESYPGRNDHNHSAH